MAVTARACFTGSVATTAGDAGGGDTGRQSVDGARFSRSVLPVDRPAATRCLCAGDGDHARAFSCPISVCRPSIDIRPFCDASLSAG